MQIVGRLIKKTTEIGSKINSNPKISFDFQINTLESLIEKAKKRREFSVA